MCHFRHYISKVPHESLTCAPVGRRQLCRGPQGFPGVGSHLHPRMGTIHLIALDWGPSRLRGTACAAGCDLPVGSDTISLSVVIAINVAISTFHQLIFSHRLAISTFYQSLVAARHSRSLELHAMALHSRCRILSRHCMVSLVAARHSLSLVLHTMVLHLGVGSCPVLKLHRSAWHT